MASSDDVVPAAIGAGAIGEDTPICIDGDFPVATTSERPAPRSKKATKASSVSRATSAVLPVATFTPGFALLLAPVAPSDAAWHAPSSEYISGADVHVAASTYDADDEDVEFVRSLRRPSTTTSAKGRAAAASASDALLDVFEHAIEALETESYVRKTVAASTSMRHKLRLQHSQVQTRVHSVVSQYTALAERQDGVAYESHLPGAAAVAAVSPSVTSTPTDTPKRVHTVSARSSTERRRLLSLSSPQATAAALDSSSDMHVPADVAVPIIVHALQEYSGASTSVEAGAATARRAYDHWLRKRMREHGLPLLPCFHVVSAGDVASDLPLHVLARIVGPHSLAPVSSDADDAEAADMPPPATTAIQNGGSASRGAPMRVKLRDIDANGLALARLRALRNEMEHARILVDMLQKRERMKREKLRIIGGALQEALLTAPRNVAPVPRKLRKAAAATVASAAVTSSGVGDGSITATATIELVEGLRALLSPPPPSTATPAQRKKGMNPIHRRSLLSSVVVPAGEERRSASQPPLAAAGEKRLRDDTVMLSAPRSNARASSVDASRLRLRAPVDSSSSMEDGEADDDEMEEAAAPAAARPSAVIKAPVTTAAKATKGALAAAASGGAGRAKGKPGRRDGGDADDRNGKCGVM